MCIRDSYSTASVNTVIVNLTAKWRIRPALTFGNHIQMSKYTYQLATSAVLNICLLYTSRCV